MDNINKRWKIARQELNLKQNKLSEILSIPQSTLSGYEKDVNIPASSVRSFAAICHVRESYLVNGDFPILEPEEDKSPVQKVMASYNIPEIYSYILEEWLMLPEEQQRQALAFYQRVLDRAARARSTPESNKAE